VNSDEPKKEQKIFFEPILVVLGIVLFYHPLWMSGSPFPGGDFMNLFAPMRAYTISSVFGDGQIPLWNHYTYLGTPHAAAMQHGVFYPVTNLFSFFGDPYYELKLQNLLHLCFCGVGLWFLCRKVFRFGVVPAIAAALIFPCSSWFWATMEHANRIAGVVYLPWNYAVLILFLSNRIKSLPYVIFTSLLFSFQFLSGHPQSMLYGLFVYGLIIIYFLFIEKKECFKKVYTCIVPALLLTGLLVSIQLILTLELSGYSYRPLYSKEPSYSLAVSQLPVHFLHLADTNAFDDLDEYVARQAFGEHHTFMGRLTLLAAFAGLVLLLIKRRSIGIPATLLLVFFVLFMLGGNASIYRLINLQFDTFPKGMSADAEVFGTSKLLTLSLYEFLSWIIPLLKGFRVPARIVNLFTLELVLLAAYALNEIRTLKIQHVVGGILTVLILIELYIPSRTYHFHKEYDEELLQVPTVTQNLVLRVQSDGGRVFRHQTKDHYRSTTSLLKNDVNVNDAIQARHHYLQENINVMWELPSIHGYEEGLIPTVRTNDFLRYIDGMIRAKVPDQMMLRLMGVSTLMSELEVLPPLQLDPRFEAWTHSTYFLDASAIAFWKDDIRNVEWEKLEGPFYQGENFLKNPSDNYISYGEEKQYRVRPVPIVIDLNTNSIELQTTEVNSNAIVALGYYPWWYVGGEELEWINAINTEIPQEYFQDGKLRMEFKPKAYRIGMALTGNGLMIWFYLFIVWFKRRKQFVNE